jgi:hypothetical protein
MTPDVSREEFNGHDERLDALEKTSTQVQTIGALVKFLVAFALAGAGGFIYSTISDRARLDQLEHSFTTHESAQFHRGAETTLGDVRGDLRVIQVQLQSQATTTQEIRERVTRIEDSAAGRRHQ